VSITDNGYVVVDVPPDPVREALARSDGQTWGLSGEAAGKIVAQVSEFTRE
jgi:hypothetical protein